MEMEKLTAAEKTMDDIMEKVDKLYEEKPYLFEYDDNDVCPAEMLGNADTLGECLLNIDEEDWNDSYNHQKEIATDDILKDQLRIDLSELVDNGEINMDQALDIVDCIREKFTVHEPWKEKNNYAVNVIPMQSQNANREGEELGDSLIELKQCLMGEKDWDDYKPVSVIRSLFASQGYSVKDLDNHNAVTGSRFLVSFIEEVVNTNDDYCSFLVVCLETSFNDYWNMKEKADKITVSPKTIIGLFNPTQGGGSILNIQLEKKWTFSLKDAVIQVEDETRMGNRQYGWSVDSIYGEVDRSKSRYNLHIDEN